jgi:AcrR family transcriptional regulator
MGLRYLIRLTEGYSGFRKFCETASHSKIRAQATRSHAQRNRERILEVAKQVFTRRGAEASMGEIARRSTIGPGTLYHHFATRDDLLCDGLLTEVEIQAHLT